MFFRLDCIRSPPIQIRSLSHRQTNDVIGGFFVNDMFVTRTEQREQSYKVNKLAKRQTFEPQHPKHI